MHHLLQVSLVEGEVLQHLEMLKFPFWRVVHGKNVSCMSG